MKNFIIYPDAMHRMSKIPLNDIYQILECAANEGIIEQKLQVYCPNCRKYTGEVFDTIGEIPESVKCEHCDSEIKCPIMYAIVIYKKVDNTKRNEEPPQNFVKKR